MTSKNYPCRRLYFSQSRKKLRPFLFFGVGESAIRIPAVFSIAPVFPSLTYAFYRELYHIRILFWLCTCRSRRAARRLVHGTMVRTWRQLHVRQLIRIGRSLRQSVVYGHRYYLWYTVLFDLKLTSDAKTLDQVNVVNVCII